MACPKQSLGKRICVEVNESMYTPTRHSMHVNNIGRVYLLYYVLLIVQGCPLSTVHCIKLWSCIFGLFTGKGGYDKNLQRIQGSAYNWSISCSTAETLVSLFWRFLNCLDFHHAVTDGTGCPSPAAMEAYSVCSTVCSATTKPEAGHVTIYVAEQQGGFATQQSMLLREVYNQRTQQQQQSQVLAYMWGVYCRCMKIETWLIREPSYLGRIYIVW